MKRYSQLMRILGSAFVGAIFSFVAKPVLAAAIDTGLAPVASRIALGTQDIRVIIGNIIYVALGVIGVVILVIIIYAGFLWMTAGGNEEKVEEAKKWIRNAVIGLAIVLCSYAITYFIITRLLGATLGSGNGPVFEQAVTSSFGDFGSGSLGEGVVQSVYPAPGQTNVVRNTKVIITFKVPIDPASIIASGSQVAGAPGRPSVYTGTLSLANARLVASADMASGGAFQTDASKLVSNVAAYTADDLTYVFAPAQYLGSPTQNVSYTVAFGAGVMMVDGKTPAFTGNFSSGYHWEFETGTTVDLTPPQVISVVPSPGTTVARNAVIEITFNEGVDPVSASGVFTAANPSFSNVTVSANGRVEGTWVPSNQYRTIGFRTNVLGGTNSCGDAVYVLPGGVTITVNGLSATVGDSPPQTKYYPPDGITDLAGNSLDGNANGKADGPPADNIDWNFTTTNALDLTPPTVTAVAPAPESGNADLGKPVTISFDKPMSITTLTNSNLVFDTFPNLPLWYFGEGTNLDASGSPVTSMNDPVATTQGVIEHERLAPTVGKCSAGPRNGSACAVDADCPAAVCTKQVFFYYPKATSGVTDIYQNCFLPACGGPLSDPTRRYCCPSLAGDVSCRTECAINQTSGKLYCDETK